MLLKNSKSSHYRELGLISIHKCPHISHMHAQICAQGAEKEQGKVGGIRCQQIWVSIEIKNEQSLSIQIIKYIMNHNRFITSNIPCKQDWSVDDPGPSAVTEQNI